MADAAEHPTYLRDPDAIYRESFATIRREANLAGLSPDETTIATRAIHACGMVDLVDDLRFFGDPADGARTAIAGGRPILVDAQMVAAGLIRRNLPDGQEVLCFLDDPRTPVLAKDLGTTRSAAAIHLWRDYLDGSVVIIGNAPTALFALLELIDAGAPQPAALFAFPVGFVGAAESKAELATNPRGLDAATLLGRRGGSAIAAAAFNAVFAEPR